MLQITETDGPNSNDFKPIVATKFLLIVLKYCDLLCPGWHSSFAWLQLRCMVRSLVFCLSSKQFCVEIALSATFTTAPAPKRSRIVQGLHKWYNLFPNSHKLFKLSKICSIKNSGRHFFGDTLKMKYLLADF